MRRLPWLVLAALLVAGCGRQATPVVSTVLPPLQLRLVSSSSERPCHAPPLVSAGAGTACSWDGSWTYSLGPSLGDLQPTSAQLTSDTLGIDEVLDVQLDHDSAARFEQLTADALNRQVAILLQGWVASAPIIQSRIPGGELQITGDAEALRLAAAALHATRPSAPPRPRRAFPTISAADEAEQASACAAAQPRLAPGLTGDGGLGLVQAPFTAASAAAMLAGMGDRTGAELWRRLPAGERAFLCSYSSPVDPKAPVPDCPPGQTPVVGVPAESRTFFVDARGHATEFPSDPMPLETCLPD